MGPHKPGPQGLTAELSITESGKNPDGQQLMMAVNKTWPIPTVEQSSAVKRDEALTVHGVDEP